MHASPTERTLTFARRSVRRLLQGCLWGRSIRRGSPGVSRGCEYRLRFRALARFHLGEGNKQLMGAEERDPGKRIPATLQADPAQNVS